MKNKLLILLLLAFGTVQASAQCVIPIVDGQSYIENFESGQMECWTVETSGSATWAVMNGTASNVVAFQNATAGGEARLVSPTFDMSGVSGASFSFGYAMMGFYPPYDVLTVSYRTSEGDSWHELGSYSFSDWSNVYDETFELPDISATYQISFLGYSNGGYYIFVDDIEITGAGGCARPMNLLVTELTMSSAQLGWSTTGDEESWTLELNGDLMTVDTQPFVLEGLEAATDYTVRVRANCGGGLASEWSYPTTFKTLCEPIIVTDDEPYFDDFEGSEDFICWYNDISAGDGGWVVDPGYTILNNTAFFIWMNEEAILYSAPLDITAVTRPTLEFKRRQRLLDGRVDYLYVGYRTSPLDPWHVIGTFDTPAQDWETVVIELPEASSKYQIGFDGFSNNADGVYVDDVRVGNDDGVGLEENVEAIDGPAVVYDLFGRVVATTELRDGRVDLEGLDLAAGVYVVRISDERGVRTMKIVKK